MYDFKELTIEEYLRDREEYLLIDVRSPSEFDEDSIKNAKNIPILNDSERALVGTLYKEAGIREAKKAGRDLVLPKIGVFIDDILKRRESENKKVLVYCSRGGERSALAATFIAMESGPVWRLTGGYKAYRRHILDYFSQSFEKDVRTCYGLTGSGKTELLLRLKAAGLPVIDLEGLANHRGSAFGHVGLGIQPSQKRFDSRLFEELQEIHETWVIVEGESKKIGRIYIPEGFYDKMTKGESLSITASLPCRINRIIDEYGGFLIENREEILQSLDFLKSTLGKDSSTELIQHFKEGRMTDVVSFLLMNYYDILYEKNRRTINKYIGTYDTDDMDDCVQRIIGDLKEG